MAEALGLASAVAGLASLAIQVSQISFQYVSGVRHASKIVSAYLQELSALTSVVLRLQNVLEQPQVEAALAARSSIASSTTFDECAKEMQMLKSKLERHLSEKGFRSKLKALSWPLEEKETRHFMELFHRYCNTFNVAVSAETLAVTSTTLQEARDAKQDNSRREVLEWLSPIAPDRKQDEILQQHYPGTGRWVLSTTGFTDWITKEHGILWCYGSPGVGKTFITSLVIDELAERFANEDVAISYHFCAFQDGKNQPTTPNVLRSLLKQICERRGQLPSEVLAMHETTMKSRKDPETSGLIEALLKCLHGSSSGIILIDALDEQEDRKVLMSALKELGSGYKILLTSRPLEDIKDAIGSSQNLEIVANESDMRKYAEMRLQADDERYFDLSPELRQEIVGKVAEVARGVFLLARLIMDNLEDLTTAKQVKQKLERMPSKVSIAYETTFQRVLSQSRSRKGLALRVISWVARCKRPLTVQELRYALAVEKGAEELDEDNLPSSRIIVNACLGFVLLNEETNTVRLAHYTILDFLDHHYEHFDPYLNDLEIARVCVTYLSFENFHGNEISSLEDLTELLEDYPFFEYAASNWGFHTNGRAESVAKSELLAFLSDDDLVGRAIQVLHFQRRSDRMAPASAFQAVPNGFTGLHLAAYWGLASIVQAFLENSEETSPKDSLGWTPLHWAAARGHDSTVKALISCGAQIDDRDFREWTPLSWAVRRQRSSTVALLAKHGADVDVQDEEGKTPLHYAISLQDSDIVITLLDSKARLDIPDKTGQTASAAAQGIEDLDVRELLQDAGDTESPSEPTNTEWALTAAADDPSKLQRLVRKLASTSGASDRSFWKTVHKGERNGALVTDDWSIRSFLKYGGKEFTSIRSTILHKAILTENIKLVQGLIKFGTDVHARYRTDQTYLHAAAGVKNGAITTLLFEKRVDPLAVANRGRTALHYATSLANTAVTDILMERAGLLANVQAENGEAPVHEVLQGHAKDNVHNIEDRKTVLGALCKGGANLDLQNKDGQTALHIAARKQSAPLMLKLMELGANAELKDNKGKQILHLLVEGKETATDQFALFEVFLGQYEGELSAEDWNGFTPLSMALNHGNTQMATILFERGASLGPKARSLLQEVVFVAITDRDEGFIKLLYHTGLQPNVVSPRGEPILVFGVRTMHVLLEGEELTQDQAWARIHRDKPLQPAPVTIEQAESLIRMLLDNGEDVNSYDEDGTTSLQFALRSSRTSPLVDLLLERGANVRTVNIEGRGAFHDAAESGDTTFVSRLFELSADPNLRMSSGRTPLSIAAAHGFQDVTQMMLRNEALHDANKKESDWLTIAQLVNAVEGKDINRVRALQLNQVAIDIEDKYGRTALHKACIWGDFEVVSLLLNKQANIHAVDRNDWTLFHFAAANGHPQIMQLLALKGVDVRARTKNNGQRYLIGSAQPCGALALHLAAWNGSLAAVKEYIHLCKPETTRDLTYPGRSIPGDLPPNTVHIDDGADGVGRTALMCAAQQNHLSIVKLLLEATADLNASGGSGSWGFAAIDLADGRGHQEMVEYLAEQGAWEEWWTSSGAVTAIRAVGDRKRAEEKANPQLETKHDASWVYDR